MAIELGLRRLDPASKLRWEPLALPGHGRFWRVDPFWRIALVGLLGC